MSIEILLMLLGQLSAAASIFFIRESQLSPGILAAYRLLFTTIALLPLHLRDRRRFSEQSEVKGAALFTHLIKYSALPGFFLGLHFIFWNSGARMTVVANATLLVNMTPVVMPLVIFFLTREKPGIKELGATAVAMAGALLLTVGDINLSTEHLLGDIYCFVSMIFLTVYLALSRRYRHLPFWYYIWGVYLIGGLTAFIVDVALGASLWSQRGLVELLPVLGLTVFSTLIGHNLINRAMRTLPSQIVGVGQLSQFFWAGLMAWILFGELPEPIFYPSMGLITLGTIIMILIHRQSANNRGE